MKKTNPAISGGRGWCKAYRESGKGTFRGGCRKTYRVLRQKEWEIATPFDKYRFLIFIRGETYIVARRLEVKKG